MTGEADLAMSVLTLNGSTRVSPSCPPLGQGSELVGWVLEGDVTVIEPAGHEHAVTSGEVFRVVDGWATLERRGKKRSRVLIVRTTPTALKWHRFDGPECLGDRAGHAPPTTLVRKRSDAPAYEVAGGRARVQRVLEGPDARTIYVGAFTARKGMRVPPHRHEKEAEILYVLKGAGTLTLDGKEIPLRPGMAIHVRAGREHAFVQHGEQPFEAIQLYSPPGPEQRFKAAPRPH